MRVLAFDPGGVTGVAFHDTQTGDVATAEVSEPVALAGWIDHYSAVQPTVVVEDFVGAGPRNTYSNHTLQVIGFVRWYATYRQLPVAMRQPSHRKSEVDRARSMLEIATPHAVDALAHALAYIRDHGE